VASLITQMLRLYALNYPDCVVGLSSRTPTLQVNASLSLVSDTGDLPSEDVYLMKVHEKIKFMRQSKHWSQEEMADKLRMSVNGYANIERGETDVQLSRLEKIAEIFGVELFELFNFGEQNVVYLAYENNIHFKNHNQCKNLPSSAFSDEKDKTDEKKDLKHELDKTRLLLEQREQEIAYLKKIIKLMEKGGEGINVSND